MKKSLFLLAFCVVLIQCKSYRDFISIEDVYYENVSQNLIDGQYINISVNDTLGKFLFDTGASRTLLSDVDLLGGEEIYNSKNYSGLAKFKTASGKTMKTGRFKSDSLSLKILKSLNRKVLVLDEKFNLGCRNNEAPIHGVYGLESIRESQIPLWINYSENKLQFKADTIPTNYFLVPSEFNKKSIFIILSIKNKNFKLIFDTGNNTGIFLKDSVFQSSELVAHYEVLAKLADTAVTSIRSKVGILDKLSLGSITVKNEPITITDDFRSNNAGLRFINKFDWILDFKNEKVYAKKLKDNPIEQNFNGESKQMLLVTAINDQLVIAYRDARAKQYKLGDIIATINDTVVQEKNICFFMNQLNKATNWDDYKIEIKK